MHSPSQRDAEEDKRGLLERPSDLRFHAVAGEEVLGYASAHCVGAHARTRGYLLCSTFRVVFCPRDAGPSDLALGKFSVPFATCLAVETKPPNALALTCKDFRVLRFELNPNHAALSQACAVRVRASSDAHRFAFQRSPPQLDLPLTRTEQIIIRDYHRLGVVEGIRNRAELAAHAPKPDDPRADVFVKEWRLTTANRDFALCPTYARFLAVPSVVSDNRLALAAAFRSKARVPYLCWVKAIGRNAGVCLCRSAQPLPGVRKTRSREDELLVQAIVTASNCNQLLIVDARPILNAMANQVAGKGYESVECYPQCRLTFAGIDNIHVVRASFNKLHTLVCTPPSDTPRPEGEVEATGWLQHVTAILRAANQIVGWMVGQGNSVLVHCSDGWDRTSQLTSLAMLLLDPHYRTLEGFACLVEREWVAAGHMFSRRCNHSNDPRHASESSPIFLLFLDCVWQLTEQFPAAFQFNEAFLLFLVDAVYSCEYGTFLFDSERARAEARCGQRTTSVWDAALDSSRRQEFTNAAWSGTPNALVPCAEVPAVRLWLGCYTRWSEALQAREWAE